MPKRRRPRPKPLTDAEIDRYFDLAAKTIREVREQLRGHVWP